MAYRIRFNEEKNQLLKATIGIGFDEILLAVESKNNLLTDMSHPSLNRSSQRLYVVKIGKYAYAVPYVISQQKKEIFLKTAYTSRALTKKYIKEGKHNAR